MYTTYLKHHGIQGQKWGVQNGPPYPLKSSAKSASEKKRAYTRSTSGSVSKRKVRRVYGGVTDMTDDELKSINSRRAMEDRYLSYNRKNSKSLSNDRKAADMTTQELQDYNLRRQAEDQYKDYQKKDQEAKTKNLRDAQDIVNKTKEASAAAEKSVRNYFDNEKRKAKDAIDLSNMSDSELRQIVNRMNMERQYKDLIPSETSRGEKWFNTAMNILGPTLAATAAALSIAISVKTLMK